MISRFRMSEYYRIRYIGPRSYAVEDVGTDECVSYFKSEAAAFKAAKRLDLMARVEARCRWFMLCNNIATATEQHPVLGSVRVCVHCRDWLNRMKRDKERELT